MTFGDLIFLGDDVPTLMFVNFVLLCLIALKAVVMIGAAIVYGGRFRNYLHELRDQQNETAKQQEQTAKQQAETWAVLQLVKDYAEIARSNRVEAARAAAESKDATHPTRAEIADKIDAVPGKVVEKIKGDSGQYPAPGERRP